MFLKYCEEEIRVEKKIYNFFLIIFCACLFLGIFSTVTAQKIGNFTVKGNEVECCDSSAIQAIIWSGKNPIITLHNLAAYSGPILWFSPDEPLLGDTKGKDIKLPEPFPFEDDSDLPIVYFRVRNILIYKDISTPAYYADSTDRNRSFIDLRSIVGIDLDYFFYYPTEEGLGGHNHDVESVEFKIFVW
jgi:hypothetical protein